MAMGKRDYNELADSLKKLKHDLKDATAENCDNMISLAVEAHIRRVMALCARHNVRFNSAKFRAAIED